MSAITTPITSQSESLRPFDIRKDLDAVANLVEMCFADTLDEDGRRYVSHMHAASHNPGYLRWAMAVAENTPMPFSGFVWEQNSYLAGNLSLIPYRYQGKRCYLIANVAVDPAYRRKGIGKRLTTAAIEHAHKRGINEIWLHVRTENQAAQNLYQSLGFLEQARRTTWEIKPSSGFSTPSPSSTTPLEIQVSRPQLRYWDKYRQWLCSVYPPEFTWHQPFQLSALRPGIFGSLYRFFTGNYLKEWVAQQGQRHIGLLAWQPHSKHADHLWLASTLEDEAATIAGLMPGIRRQLANRRRMLLDYPAGRAILPLHEAGFHIQQTLIWMRLS
ncbi:MAG: GNAT family N-acetyltransferase [Anaerolineales bacterium]|jgi:ribosomal protein S18 acetylase RimI-like enzyme